MKTNLTSDLPLKDARLCAKASDLFDSLVRRSSGSSIKVQIDSQVVEIPAAVAQIIAGMLDDVANGESIVVAPYDVEIGTEQAGSLLGVSRQWVTALIDRDTLGEIRREGTKRRIPLGALMSYRRDRMQERREASSQLATGALDDCDQMVASG